MPIPQVFTKDYDYELPNEKIAQHPLEERDASKLLIFREGQCSDSQYKKLSDYIPANSQIVFNDSKVIPARILYVKETSGVIELFCLEPTIGTPYQALQDQRKTKWNCLVGGLKKWKQGTILKWEITSQENCIVSAALIQKNEHGYEIEFSWTAPSQTFAEILNHLGQMPIPPYLLRKAGLEDRKRYQTVYANTEGSVAAPTAGLHFTQSIFNELDKKQIQKNFITLHVGAGTFKPVTAQQAHEHPMHAEWVEASFEFIESLCNSNSITCVGTTSLRAVESIFWYAFLVQHNQLALNIDFVLPQFTPYEYSTTRNYQAVLRYLLDVMLKQRIHSLLFKTEIMILPTYEFKIAKRLITNFHQPQSTLLMLVDAFTKGKWKLLYEHALANNYRFLSYGDGCLLEIEH